jgi:hypothetical protein
MTPKLITISILMLAGCPKPETKTVADETAESQPASTPESAPTEILPEPANKIIAVSELPSYVGKTVILRGKITDLARQHMMSPPTGTRHNYYFNIEESQIVLYTAEELSCGTTLEVTGTVLSVEGPVSRAGKPMYTEYHLSVSSWKCVE